MMLFSRYKKLKRDREAGLVFRWRGGDGGNRGGLVLAIALSSGAFALAFLGVELEAPAQSLEPRRVAKITLLNELSPELSQWVAQQSPFPSRWDPVSDVENNARVAAALEQTYVKISAPPSPWISMPAVEEEASEPSLLEVGVAELGDLPKATITKVSERGAELAIVLEFRGSLAKRLGEKHTPFQGEIPKQRYGEKLRFALSVDTAGRVLYCVPVEWRDDTFAKRVENWLRLQQFSAAPEAAGLDFSEVIISVEVKGDD